MTHFDRQGPPLKDYNDSFIRERGVSKKNVSLTLLGAVNVTAHCKEMCPGPGLINQSSDFQVKAFINMFETCLAALG